MIRLKKTELNKAFIFFFRMNQFALLVFNRKIDAVDNKTDEIMYFLVN